MAKAASGGGGHDILLLAAVGAMAFLALRSRAASAAVGGVPVGTVAQLRPDYSAQRNIAYATAGAGLLSSIIGAFRSGSPDAVIGGAPVTGIFGGGLSNALEYNAHNGFLGQLGIDATDGWTPGQFGSMNGAYTFGSPVESPSLGNYMGWAG